MTLHELTKDALRFGALRQLGGRLHVRWRVEADDERQRWLVVDWQETGVTMPPGDAPSRDMGDGRALIESALPYQLRARTRYDVVADGLRCSIAMPIADID